MLGIDNIFYLDGHKCPIKIWFCADICQIWSDIVMSDSIICSSAERKCSQKPNIFLTFNKLTFNIFLFVAGTFLTGFVSTENDI